METLKCSYARSTGREAPKDGTGKAKGRSSGGREGSTLSRAERRRKGKTEESGSLVTLASSRERSLVAEGSEGKGEKTETAALAASAPWVREFRVAKVWGA